MELPKKVQLRSDIVALMPPNIDDGSVIALATAEDERFVLETFPKKVHPTALNVPISRMPPATWPML